jgi:hypothetical protein
MIYKSMFSALVDVCKNEFALKDHRAQHSTAPDLIFSSLFWSTQIKRAKENVWFVWKRKRKRD